MQDSNNDSAGRKFFKSIDIENMFLKTDTKPGLIQTLQQNHNHKYLYVKGTKDTFL